MTAPTPNAALAYRVLDHIDAHPEQWNQGLYIFPADCGTVACFAGWACLLSGETPTYPHGAGYSTSYLIGEDDSMQSVPERAQQLLGASRYLASGVSDDDEGWDLFDPSNNREDLGRLVAEIFGPRPDGDSRTEAPA